MQFDPLAKSICLVTAVSVKPPSRFGFKWQGVRAWGENSCGLDTNATRAYKWGSPLHLRGNTAQKWRRHLSAISQEWSTISLNTAKHLFPPHSSTEPKLPSPHTCCSCRVFMTCEFKRPFLLHHDKLFKGWSAWVYSNSPSCWNMENTKCPWFIAGQHSDYSSRSAPHTLEESK